jgi:hypothetical protein
MKLLFWNTHKNEDINEYIKYVLEQRLNSEMDEEELMALMPWNKKVEQCKLSKSE